MRHALILIGLLAGALSDFSLRYGLSKLGVDPEKDVTVKVREKQFQT